VPDWLGIHYHIRWSGKTALDWERFATAEDAESSATRMVRRVESYRIEKFDDDCVRGARTYVKIGCGKRVAGTARKREERIGSEGGP
jgi:hypothetical protein